MKGIPAFSPSISWARRSTKRYHLADMFIKETGTKEYDVAIVGTGPAGISLALRLSRRSETRILLIESGDLNSQNKTNILQAARSGILRNRPGEHKLAEVEATGDLSSKYFSTHSQRMFGGTSSVWSGFCTTLEKRAFLNAEWPIDHEEITPYYKEAAVVLELPKQAHQTPIKRILPDSCGIRYRPYYMSSPVRFGDKYYALLNAQNNIDVLLNKTCTNILSSGNRITGLTVRSSDGDSFSDSEVKADHYVLACGGIGNARLMQLADTSPALPVGHKLMDHPHIYNAGVVELNREVIEPVLSKGRVIHALQLSDGFCLDNNLLSFTVSFNIHSIENRVFLGEQKSAFISPVTVRSEMMPQVENRVFLGEQLDYLEQAKASVNFKFNYQSTAKNTWDAFARELLASGIGRATTPPDFDQQITGGGHIIGTTRMGNSAANSVVDGNCKVHNKDNLYIAGSSIFPASAAANPTFSIVALSLKLADHLAKRIQGLS